MSIGAGIYRETVLVGGGTFTSPGSVVTFTGDVTGALTGDAGEVVLTNYTTNDSTAAVNLATLDFNSRGNLTFDSITIISGSSSTPIVSTGAVANCANVTFKRCFMFSLTSSVLNATFVTDTNMNWLFEKCILVSCASVVMAFTCPTSTVADYNMGLTIRNCLLIVPNGVNGISFTGSGAGAFKPGGASIYDTTIYDGTSQVRVITAAGFSTTIPITVYNCAFIGTSSPSVNAATSGQIVEDFNYFSPTSPRTNVTAGANSKAGNVLYPGIHYGQDLLYGFIGRPFAMPTVASPLLGFGNKASSPTPPTDDLLGRNRPEGGGSTSNAIGALERHDTATLDASPPAGRTSKAYLLTGPGSMEVVIPVDTTSSTISIYTQFDANYTGTNYPQVQIVNGEEAGVTAQTVTATVSASGAWLQLTFSAFTATIKGEVTLRLVSRSGGATGKCWFADYAIA